jgi:branched-subunit amino acid aminotransferase/4-amino-4-deoxychorismate lyase
MATESHVIYNGEIYPAEQPLFLHNNRAFCYGDALFETMHAFGTDVQFLSKHLTRLHAGMSILKMDTSVFPDQNSFDKQIKRLLNRDKIFGGARVRLTVFRNNGGYYTPDTNEVSYIIEALALEHEKYYMNPKGLVVDVYRDMRKQANVLSPYKTTNSLLFVMAGLYKKAENLDECLILNDNNHVIESISSNVFIVKDNVLLTPPIEQGCVAGVMRESILSLAKKEGINVETNISINESNLPVADEIFLTNAVRGIQWVVGYKQTRYYNKMARHLAEELNKTTF